MLSDIAEPWRSFLKELDDAASDEVHLHCTGGFVVTQFYGFDRYTADVDALWIAPTEQQRRLLEKGGKGAELHKKYGVYLDLVTVASYPYDYDERLTEMLPGLFKHLRLFALDPYDLILTKLNRNIIRDREDARYLAKAKQLDLSVLRQRYETEL